MQLGAALRDDPTLQARVDDVLQRVVATSVDPLRATTSAGLISATVARWDADETSRRLELQVGP